MFFNSIKIKEINRLRKEISRSLSNGMSNIYLKVTIEEKNRRSQSFDFLDLKKLSPPQFWEAATHEDVIDFKTSCWNLKIRGLGAKL